MYIIKQTNAIIGSNFQFYLVVVKTTFVLRIQYSPTENTCSLHRPCPTILRSRVSGRYYIGDFHYQTNVFWACSVCLVND